MVLHLSRKQHITRLTLVVLFQCCQLVAQPPDSNNALVPLTVPAGTPLRLYLTKRVWYRLNTAVTAKLIEPVWAFDRIMIPAGTLLDGRVAGLKSVPKLARLRAIAGGDFTPLKIADLSFTGMTLPDGKKMPLQATIASPALNTIYTPKTSTQGNGASSKQTGIKSKIRQQARQQYESSRDSVIYFVRGQNKREWVEEWLLQKLPYHPQWYRARTRVDALLSQPVEFGSAAIRVDQAHGYGRLPDAVIAIQLRMGTTVTSANADVGTPLTGTLTKPVFAANHELVLPAGTLVSGTVTMVERARWFHRGGKLRLSFEKLNLPAIAGLPAVSPAPQQIQAQLSGVEASPGDVKVDSEGTAKATESKTRFLRPVVAAFAAARSADDDRDSSHSTGTNSSVSGNPNQAGRALGGFSGFGILGTAASFGPRAIGASLGYYGLAWSIYSNLLSRGREIVFEKNSAVELRLGQDMRRGRAVNKPQILPR